MAPPVVIVVAGAAAAAATGFAVYKYVWEPYVSPRMDAWRATAYYASHRNFRQRSRGEPIIIPSAGSSTAFAYDFADRDIRQRRERNTAMGVEMVDFDSLETPTAATMAEHGSQFPYSIPVFQHLSATATPTGTITPVPRVLSPDIVSQGNPVAIQSPRSPDSNIGSLSDFSNLDREQTFSPFSQPSVLSDNGLSASFASLTPDSIDGTDPFSDPQSDSSPTSQNLSLNGGESDSDDLTGSWLSVNSNGVSSSDH